MKKKLMLFSVILSVLLLIASSCAQNGGNDADDTVELPAAEDAVSEQEEPGEPPGRWARIDPGLPERDFGGYTFNILSWYVGLWGGAGGNDGSDLWVEELIGEAFNDAVYHRNRAIEERYNININLIRMDIFQINSSLRNAIAAGDNAYDLVFQRMHEVSGFIQDGSLVDLHSVPYLNFEQPWWDERSVEQLSLGGRAFIAASDITTSDKNAVSCVLFNKQLAQDHAFENLYDVVRRGDWTLGYMMEISRGTARDLDGDGILGVNDFIPIEGEDLTTMILFNGAGSTFAAHDSDGMPYSSFLSPRNIRVVEKILDLMYDNELYSNTYSTMFENNRSIFFIHQLRNVIHFRALEADFGVLPVPKFDTNQEEYLSSINIHHSGLMAIPISAPDLERTGLIVEALAAESRFTVMPAYYDLALVGRFLRDDESEESLDIIFSGRKYDLGDLFAFGGFATEWLRIYATRSRDIVSMYERRENQIQRDIQRLIDRVLEMG